MTILRTESELDENGAHIAVWKAEELGTVVWNWKDGAGRPHSEIYRALYCGNHDALVAYAEKQSRKYPKGIIYRIWMDGWQVHVWAVLTDAAAAVHREVDKLGDYSAVITHYTRGKDAA